MDQVAYVLYTDQGDLWHQRWLLGTPACSPSKAIWVSPDGDVAAEDVENNANLIVAVRWGAGIRPSPPGVRRVYRFARAPSANQLNVYLGEALTLADQATRQVNGNVGVAGQNLVRFVPGACGVPAVAAAVPGGGAAAGGAAVAGGPAGAVAAMPAALPAGPLARRVAGGGVRPAVGAGDANPVAGEWRCAADWAGYAYGEVVQVPPGTAGQGAPPRALIGLQDGSLLFVEYVLAGDLEAFLARGSSRDARLLPLVHNHGGKRDRSLASVVEDMREEPFPELTLRTTEWCLRHLLSEGRGLEAHYEHFRQMCSIQPEQWGMEEYSTLINVAKQMLFVDQLDPTNSAGLEFLFRRLQTLEYSYSDKLREKTAGSSKGRLTLDEQAAFGAAARAESRLMISPALMEAAHKEVDKEAALAKALLKSREARAALAAPKK